MPLPRFMKPATKGELLWVWLVQHHYNNCAERLSGQEFLLLSGRPEGMGQYVEGVVLSFSFIRLMTAAKSIFSAPKDITVCMSDMRAYINNWMHWLDSEQRNRLVRLVREACESSDRPISAGTRQLAWPRGNSDRCYMCSALLTLHRRHFVDANGKNANLDHIWPSSLGGNSIPENLLLACQACNNAKKHLLTWESGHAHSLIYTMGFETHDFYSRVPRLEKILIHRRAAFVLACRERLTLRDAFQKLGGYSELQVIDSSDTWDFFNVENHSQGLGELLWHPS
jgi:5-methylcytosine-specific restriction endonuclease McrA